MLIKYESNQREGMFPIEDVDMENDTWTDDYGKKTGLYSYIESHNLVDEKPSEPPASASPSDNPDENPGEAPSASPDTSPSKTPGEAPSAGTDTNPQEQPDVSPSAKPDKKPSADRVEGTATGGTVYAGYVKEGKEYTIKITYDLNGAEKSSPVSIVNGKLVLRDVKKNGYSFTGWYSNGQKVDADNYDFTEDLTITAGFEANNYSIRYQTDGGYFKTRKIRYDYKNRTVTLPKVYKEGYKFTGWYLKDGTKVKSISKKVYKGVNVTVYAKYEPVKYSVKFNLNGGKYTNKYNKLTTMKNLSYDKDYRLGKAEIYHRKGYKFTGWNTRKNGTGISVKDEGDFKNLKNKKGTVTLYAQWQKW